jgi:hypothetical protein
MQIKKDDVSEHIRGSSCGIQSTQYLSINAYQHSIQRQSACPPPVSQFLAQPCCYQSLSLALCCVVVSVCASLLRTLPRAELLLRTLPRAELLLPLPHDQLGAELLFFPLPHAHLGASLLPLPHEQLGAELLFVPLPHAQLGASLLLPLPRASLHLHQLCASLLCLP